MKSVVNMLNNHNKVKLPVSFFDQVQKDTLKELWLQLMNDQFGNERFVLAMKEKLLQQLQYYCHNTICEE